MMWTRGLLAALAFGMVWFLSAPAAEPAGKSALESNPEGWIDLFPGKDLKGWKRVPIPAGDQLNPKNAWSVDAEAKLLHCDGVGVKEILMHDRVFGDGIFHVEWRFRKVEGKTGYNSGVYVRTAADGKIWHQAQVVHQKDRPTLGDLFGDTLVDGASKRFLNPGAGVKYGKEPGEWNTYEVTCKGKTITVWINGTVATTWADCQVPRGHVGLQAEFWYIDFRNLKFKELK